MTSFWTDEPAVLLRGSSITEIWPRQGMDQSAKLNAISRLVILLTLVGFALTSRWRIVITGLITLGCVVMLRRFKASAKGAGKEGFMSPAVYEATRERFTTPSKGNPAMNVLLPAVKDDPERRPAAPSFTRQVEKEMNAATQDFVVDSFEDAPDKEELKDKLFKDLGDGFDFDQSMRSWYATPNTQVPNNLKAFAEYCYGVLISCKEGNGLACERNAPPRWTNN